MHDWHGGDVARPKGTEGPHEGDDSGDSDSFDSSTYSLEETPEGGADPKEAKSFDSSTYSLVEAPEGGADSWEADSFNSFKYSLDEAPAGSQSDPGGDKQTIEGEGESAKRSLQWSSSDSRREEASEIEFIDDQPLPSSSSSAPEVRMVHPIFRIRPTTRL